MTDEHSKSSSSSPATHANSNVWRILTYPVGPRAVVGRDIAAFLRRFHRHNSKDVVAGADVPANVKVLINDVNRRTHLWRTERIDIAMELIAHFQDAIAHGTSADETIREFGDLKQAARLIRRAKKRNRPLIWHAWIHTSRISIAVLLLACAVYVVLAIRYFTGKPIVSRNYVVEMNTSISTLPQGQCAWPMYRKAILSLHGTVPYSLLNYSGSSPITDVQRKEIGRVLDNLQPSLEIMRDAARRPYIGAPVTLNVQDDREVWEQLGAFCNEQPMTVKEDALVPASESTDDGDLSNVGLGGYDLPVSCIHDLLVADCRVAIVEHAGNRTFADLEALIGLADQHWHAPLFVDDRRAMEMLRLASSLISQAISQQPDLFNQSQLITLAHRLAACNGGGVIHARYDRWRIWFDDDLQHMYSDDGNGDGRLTSSGLYEISGGGYFQQVLPLFDPNRHHEWLVGPLAMVSVASRREVVEKFNHEMNQLNAEANLPMWQWKHYPGSTLDKPEDGNDAEYFEHNPVPSMWLLSGIGVYSELAEMATQERDGALAVIALEMYRQKYGVYPLSLDKLVPEFLLALPIDRFTGQTLVYHLKDGYPILYSVGPDRTDDGGIAMADESVNGMLEQINSSRATKADLVFWTSQ